MVPKTRTLPVTALNITVVESPIWAKAACQLLTVTKYCSVSPLNPIAAIEVVVF
jgi:hypothetical protein